MWGLLEGISLEPELAAQDLPRRMLGPEDGQKGGEAGGLGVCVGGLVVGGGPDPAPSFPTLLPFEHAPRMGLGGISSLHRGGMKRRIVRWRVWLPARNQSSKGEEEKKEKGRAGGGWGKRPREIAGGRGEGERPGGSRSQPSGSQGGLGRS